MAHVCLHSESGYTLGFRRKIAHNGSHGETGGILGGGGITTLGPFRTFTNIPGPGIRTASFAAFGAWSGVLPKNAKSLRDSDALMRVAVPRRRGPAGLRNLFLLLSELWLVHTRLSEKNRTQGHTRRNRWRFGWGWYHYPRSVSHVSETLRGQVSERQTLPLLGLGWVYSRRTQRACGTAMRLCASLSRGVAAPLGCVIFFAFVEIAACTPCAQSFPRVQGGERYHYPRRALHVLETLDGRLSKRLVCRFLRSMGIAPRATPIFLRIYRYPCR